MADAPGPQTRHPQLPAAAPGVPQRTSSQVCSRRIGHVTAGAGEAGDGGQRGPEALPLRQEDGVEAPTTLRRAATSRPANARPSVRPREDTPDAQRGDTSAASARTGRRPGHSSTRATIAEAALHQFAAHGYTGASMRSIAQEAGVDPALIAYFFGSKRGLFNEVMRLRWDPHRVVTRVLDGESSGVGERLVTVACEMLADAQAQDTVIGLVRAAGHDRHAATLIRVLLAEEILKPVASGLEVAEADLRAELALSQILGLVLGRHVIGLETLSASTPARLRRTLGVTLQRCLVGPLD